MVTFLAPVALQIGGVAEVIGEIEFDSRGEIGSAIAEFLRAAADEFEKIGEEA